MNAYEKRRKQEADRQWVNGLVSSAQNRKWYGTLHVIVEGGQIRRVVNETSLRPPSDDKPQPSGV